MTALPIGQGVSEKSTSSRRWKPRGVRCGSVERQNRKSRRLPCKWTGCGGRGGKQNGRRPDPAAGAHRDLRRSVRRGCRGDEALLSALWRGTIEAERAAHCPSAACAAGDHLSRRQAGGPAAEEKKPNIKGAAFQTTSWKAAKNIKRQQKSQINHNSERKQWHEARPRTLSKSS